MPNGCGAGSPTIISCTQGCRAVRDKVPRLLLWHKRHSAGPSSSWLQQWPEVQSAFHLRTWRRATAVVSSKESIRARFGRDASPSICSTKQPTLCAGQRCHEEVCRPELLQHAPKQADCPAALVPSRAALRRGACQMTVKPCGSGTAAATTPGSRRAKAGASLRASVAIQLYVFHS